MVELVSALTMERTTMITAWNRTEISDQDARLLHSMLNEVLHGFNASEYSDFFKYNKYKCECAFEKLKKSIKFNRVMFYGDIAKEEWVAMFETFRAVMFDFFEYNEFHTRLGHTFHECIDLFSRISTLLIDEQNGQK